MERTPSIAPHSLVAASWPGRAVALAEVLVRRRSARAFAVRGTPTRLALLLARSVGIALERWTPSRGDASDAPSLTVRYLALHVVGLRPGVYELSHGALTPLRHVERASLAQVMTDPWFGAAHFIAVIDGDVDEAGRTHVAHYRDLLVRAGTIAHEGWLAALSIGLIGCMSAGVQATEYARVAGRDVFRHRALVATAVGLAPSVQQLGRDQSQHIGPSV